MSKPITPEEMKAWIDATWNKCQSEAWKESRKWVGLTEEDFSAINQSCATKLQAAASAESILKEKNHA